MSLDLFLDGIRAELEAGLGITVVDGFIEGPLEAIPQAGYGCVYPVATQEVEEDVHYEELLVAARLFKPYPQQFDPTQPLDTTGLRALRADVVAALKDRQTTALGVWFFRIAGFTINAPRQWIEAEIVGRQQAEFTAGA